MSTKRKDVSTEISTLNKFALNQTVKNDIFKRYAWIRIYLNDGVTTYLGQMLMCEENCREPIAVLATYQLVNRKGDIIIDNSNCNREFIILNLKDFERAELIDVL